MVTLVSPSMRDGHKIGALRSVHPIRKSMSQAIAFVQENIVGENLLQMWYGGDQLRTVTNLSSSNVKKLRLSNTGSLVGVITEGAVLLVYRDVGTLVLTVHIVSDFIFTADDTAIVYLTHNRQHAAFMHIPSDTEPDNVESIIFDCKNNEMINNLVTTSAGKVVFVVHVVNGSEDSLYDSTDLSKPLGHIPPTLGQSLVASPINNAVAVQGEDNNILRIDLATLECTEIENVMADYIRLSRRENVMYGTVASSLWHYHLDAGTLLTTTADFDFEWIETITIQNVEYVMALTSDRHLHAAVIANNEVARADIFPAEIQIGRITHFAVTTFNLDVILM
jgi:CBS domain-containing protein